MQHLTYPYGVLPTAVSEVTEKLSFDAFSKLRVSEAYGLFESKFITSKQAHVWEDLTDTSGVSTYLPDESSVKIEVGTGANDYCIRQTFKYWPYVAGNSQRILLTGNFQSKDTGRVKRIGLFDDDNGVYFELADDDLYCVVRSKTSGTVVNTRVKRTAFNVDKKGMQVTISGNDDVFWSLSHIDSVYYLRVSVTIIAGSAIFNIQGRAT